MEECGQEEVEHGVDSAHWNNIGRGWQICCLCGWGSGCYKRMQDVGEEFDGHIIESLAEAIREVQGTARN